MKKYYVLLFLGLILSVNAKAKQYDDAPRNEISVSYGLGPAYYIFDGMAQALGAVVGTVIIYPWTGKAVEMTSKTNVGVVNLDYNYHVLDWLAVGANASFSEAHGDIVSDGKKIGKETDTYYTLMPNVKFDWFRREHFSMYSRVSFGALYAHEKRSGEGKTESADNWTWMAQVSLIGFEFGGNKIRGFSEYGIGQAGFAQAGIRIRF